MRCTKCLQEKEAEAFHKDKRATTGLCSWCRKCKNKDNTSRARKREAPYLIHRKSFCEACGFIAKHPCQLDVDHVDSNRKNNSLDNLKTLCANCHRLKTWENNEYINGRKLLW